MHFRGDVLRSVPDRPDVDPLDFRYAGVASGNRWNDAGTPAVYFASTWETSLAEYSRNLDASTFGRGGRSRRAVFRIGVTLDHIVDLTEPRVIADLGLAHQAPTSFLDRNVARATARRVLGSSPTVQGLRVPSMAFLDRPSEWNLVVYLERVDPSRAFTLRGRVGTYRVDPWDEHRFGWPRRVLESARRAVRRRRGFPREL